MTGGRDWPTRRPCAVQRPNCGERFAYRCARECLRPTSAQGRSPALPCLGRQLAGWDRFHWAHLGRASQGTPSHREGTPSHQAPAQQTACSRGARLSPEGLGLIEFCFVEMPLELTRPQAREMYYAKGFFILPLLLNYIYLAAAVCHAVTCPFEELSSCKESEGLYAA